VGGFSNNLNSASLSIVAHAKKMPTWRPLLLKQTSHKRIEFFSIVVQIVLRFILRLIQRFGWDLIRLKTENPLRPNAVKRFSFEKRK